MGGETPAEGRLEVFYGMWGTVCDDHWTAANTTVACRQLGYEGSSQWFSEAHFGAGYGTIQMDNVECDGTETRLADCDFIGWGQSNCEHSEDVGVRCAASVSPEAEGEAE